MNPSNTLIDFLPCCFAEFAGWFDDATVDVPAEHYFFGFNSLGPNCSSSISGAVGYGIAFSDYHLLCPLAHPNPPEED
jgi:hypothetical protein